ncbi:uncharacterized protein LOC120287400 [Eucalyptus grandis]|uniref:uncharacterized protein LOC120287400 n=1 Tax=Eucalyptus grandis TaxID=71139 RepID=UPI00192EDBB3|nr:uncharacterized protein LOC120287400 [Eucalyptus grandis]
MPPPAGNIVNLEVKARESFTPLLVRCSDRSPRRRDGEDPEHRSPRRRDAEDHCYDPDRSRRDGSEDGGGQAVRGELLQDVRREPGGLGEPVWRRVVRGLRGPEDPGQGGYLCQKLTSIQQCRYQFANVNCIPCGAPGGVLVVVSGYMWLDGQQDALVFNQTFQLMPAPEGSFYIAQQLWMTCAFNLRRTPLAMTPLAMSLH